MNVTKFISIAVVLSGFAQPMLGQSVVSLDSCRSMALHNNKELRIMSEKVTKAGYQRKEARSAYLPALDLNATYLYNQKNLSLVEDDQYLPIKQFNPKTGTYDFMLVTDPTTGMPVLINGQPIPSQVALLPKSALTYDINHVFAGAITLTQPVFMGGKIRAMNEITRYAEQLALTMRDNAAEDVIYAVDEAYWQVVSLASKKQLAESYVQLLDTLNRNVERLLAQGIATKAEVLSVAVKLNEAQVALTRVENGLALSRMLLAQQCGMPATTVLIPVDEGKEIQMKEMPQTSGSIQDILARRKDVHALELGVKIYEQKAKVARADMMPKLALIGAYTVTNPNSFNGFKNKFAGMFSVGAMLTVPLWHWGGNYNKYRAAKSDARVQQLQLEYACDKIELQVSQARFKMQEALKIYQNTQANLDQANENLRIAKIGFNEGVLTTDNVMAAQTAWLKAGSEAIDAQIDLQLCSTYLAKVAGEMNY